MDLHLHTVYSDGELTPEEVLYEAKKHRVSLIAFTDHDEVGAYEEGKALAKRLGIKIIPGIELNTDGPDGELHILGYQFDPNHEALKKHIAWRKFDRKQWAKEIVDRLGRLGYAITFDDCLKRSPGEIIVRTHIADELVAKEYFTTSKEAYDHLLKKGKPGFVEREKFSAKDAIDLIHQAGGVAYLAHPGIYPFHINIERIIGYGLDGIEVFHSKHTKEQAEFWLTIAQKYHLPVSGGSDHHGPNSRNPFDVGSVRISNGCKEYWHSRVGAMS